MMKRLTVLIMSCFVILIAQPSQAAMSGNDLHEHCSQDGPGGVLCLGYISGLSDGVGYLNHQRIQTGQKAYYCEPKTIQLGQMIDVVKLYMEKHPEQRHNLAIQMYILAMGKAFPCP